MTSSPGFPSAHPAAYVPVTLVGDPRPTEQRTPVERSGSTSGGATTGAGSPSGSAVAVAPEPRSPLDASIGSAPAVSCVPPAPAARGTSPSPSVPTPAAGRTASPVRRAMSPIPGPPSPFQGSAVAPGHLGHAVVGQGFPPAPGHHMAGARVGPAFGFPAHTPASVPPHLAAALNQPARPGTVVAAGVLWMLAALVELLFAAAAFATGGLPVFLPVLALLAGIATATLTVLMLRGSDAARIAVTIVGGCAGCVVLLPLVLFVPAAIVTLHPSSTAWFTDAEARRKALAAW